MEKIKINLHLVQLEKGFTLVTQEDLGILQDIERKYQGKELNAMIDLFLEKAGYKTYTLNELKRQLLEGGVLNAE